MTELVEEINGQYIKSKNLNKYARAQHGQSLLFLVQGILSAPYSKRFVICTMKRYT